MLAINGLYMNLKTRYFRNPHMRMAFTLALDRTTLVRRALGSSATPFGGNVPIGEAGYDPQIRLFPHDETQARRQLVLAGHANGNGVGPITLFYGDDACNPRAAKLAGAVAKAWHKVLNIEVSTQALTLITLLAKIQSGSLPLYLAGWSADFPDPHDWLSLQWESNALNNNVHYRNSRFDTLVERADVTWDYGRRMALDNAAQQVLVNDAAWIPLYIPHRLVFVSPTVSNLSITGYGIIPTSGSWAGIRVQPVPSKAKRHRDLD